MSMILRPVLQQAGSWQVPRIWCRVEEVPDPGCGDQVTRSGCWLRVTLLTLILTLLAAPHCSSLSSVVSCL